MTPEQRKKLLATMVDVYESRRDPSRGGPESAMRVTLAVAEQAIRDDYERMVYEECGDNIGDMISAMKGSPA